MSGGGGFRGRGSFGTHGHRRSGPGPDFSGGSGSRGGSGLRHTGPSGPRPDGTGSAPPGPNFRHDARNSCPDGSNSLLGGPTYNARGGGPPRGPCPKFNPAQRPPRHPGQPPNNWAPRGVSPHFSPWRGGRPTRFNGPPRGFYRGRGQGPFAPRFPYMGNFRPPYMPYPPIPDPKPVEQKPAVPHLGSEEERQQKITEAADALKRKLSAVAREPDVWRDDDDEGLAELSRDTDHDSRITNKGIPELKHDPPELNLTVSDLRDIGRVDHDHRTTEPTRTNAQADENFECDESEVEILAHNPVRPMIEIDLWSDDNYGEYGEDECDNRITGTQDICRQESQSEEDVRATTQREIPSSEMINERQAGANVDSFNEEPEAAWQVHSNRSGERDKARVATTIRSRTDKTDAEPAGEPMIEQQAGIIANNVPGSADEREATIEASENMAPQIREKEGAGNWVGDDFDKSNVKERTDLEAKSRRSEDVNDTEFDSLRPGERSEVVAAIAGKETKDSRKEVTRENLVERGDQRSEVSINRDSRVGKESERRQEDIAQETRHETKPKASQEKKENRMSVELSVKPKAQPNAITTRSNSATPSERRDEAEHKKGDNVAVTTSNESYRGKKSQEKSSDSRFERKIKREPREKTEATTKCDPPSERTVSNIEKSGQVFKPAVKKASKLRRQAARSLRYSTASNVPLDLDSREPPPMDVAKNLGDFDRKPMRVSGEENAEPPHIPPAFDPRLSAVEKTNLLPSGGSSVSSVIPVARDFRMTQSYAPHPMTNYTSIVPAISYGSAPIIVAPSIEPPGNIQPIRLSDHPYTPLLSLPNVPVVAPIALPPDNSMLLPPFIERPPPPPSPAKVNPDMDAGLEDMQEAMEFASSMELMNMTEGGGTTDPVNSVAMDFFHMPTFPNLPPVVLSSLADIPPPPELDGPTQRRKFDREKTNDNRAPKIERVTLEVRPNLEESRKNMNTQQDAGEAGLNVKDEIRPRVVFNLNSRSKLLTRGDEWRQQQSPGEAADRAPAATTAIPISEIEKYPAAKETILLQQQHREEANEAAAAAVTAIYSTNIGQNWKKIDKSSPIAIASPVSREKNLDDRKKLRNLVEKSDANISRFNGNNSMPKKPEESPSHSRSRSRSPSRTKPGNIDVAHPADCEITETVPRKIVKESTARKSTDETPESSWKSRVIGKFLKMSKSDICNMLNNTSLRKFDIAMKHLVKERRSTLSLGMRNNEEEKLKDPEASYNQEFMEQLTAMLDPSATVDVCNLPTQFLHHLSEVLQLESMSEFGVAPVTSESVEVAVSTPPLLQQQQQQQQQQARQTTRLPRENANTREIDDRRPCKRGREKKSIDASSSAVDTSVATALPAAPVATAAATAAEAGRASRVCKESVEPQCAVREERIVDEARKAPATIVTRARRHHHRSSIPEHVETASMNGSTGQGTSSSSLNLDLDDIFSAGIARAKKKAAHHASTSEKMNAGERENEANPGCRTAGAKEPSEERVERTVVELDKIFTAGIARAKLASKKAAAAAARATEADNDSDDDDDDDNNDNNDDAAANATGWKHAEDGRSNSRDNRARHRSLRHSARCDKWNRRKARENPDAFRNLTKEEWEARYGETSDSTYEREYRAIIAGRAHESGGHSFEASLRDKRDGFADEATGAGGGGVMSRLGNKVTEPALNESWIDSEEEQRRLCDSFATAGRPTDPRCNTSDEDASSSTSRTSTSSTEDSEPEKNETAASVTHLLKVIKAREKIGKKRSVNEEIRDEVTADIERKRRDRDARVSRKGHKSRTKKSHRRKKDKRVRVKDKKKNRERRRRKRRSRKSGGSDGSSGDEEEAEEEEEEVVNEEGTPRQTRGLLTIEDIKKENDVIVVKVEPENESEKSAVARLRSKSALATGAPDDRASSSSASSASSLPGNSGASVATLSPTVQQMKTKAQLKQLPELPGKIGPVAEISREPQRKPETPVREDPEVKASKIVITSAASVPTSQPAAIASDEVHKTISKKLDVSAYKERRRLRLLRENKRVVETTGPIGQTSEDPKEQLELARTEESPSIATSDATCATTNETATGTVVSKTSTVSARTWTITMTNSNSREISDAAAEKTPVILTATAETPTVGATSATTPDISTESDKTSAISMTTNEISRISNANSTPLTTVDQSRVSVSECDAVQRSPTSTQLPDKRIVRRKSATQQCVGAESTQLPDAGRVDAGKFAHIKSEGKKELMLREKLKKGRQRVPSEGLETTIPTRVSPPRVKRQPNMPLATIATESEPLVADGKIEEPTSAGIGRFDCFKKGVVSDGLPDTVPRELLSSVTRGEPTKMEHLFEQQNELDSLSLPINELSSWPLEPSISTSIADDIHQPDESPPFKGFVEEAILGRDRVLTEAELNSDVDALDTVPLSFETGADSLPMSTVVDLNELRTTGFPLDEPMSYGDEDFVEGRGEIETTLLGFSVTNEISDDRETVGIAGLGVDEFIGRNVEGLPEKFTEESRESLDILPRVTSTLTDSPAPVDFLTDNDQRRQSIPSPLLVPESTREHNEESFPRALTTGDTEEKRKMVNTSCDDAALVTSSHETHDNAAARDCLEAATVVNSETSCSGITSAVGGDNETSRGPTIMPRDNAAAGNVESGASEAQEMPEKGTTHGDEIAKDSPSMNLTPETIRTPPPQPTSSSDSVEERSKEKQRDDPESREIERKSKGESTHRHGHSKSRVHGGGKSKRKSAGRYNDESRSKRKTVITEEMVSEAVAANVVKFVSKPPSCKETVMARMIEIDVEIHKLMNEKMTLYKMLESGEFPAKGDAGGSSGAKTTGEPRVSSEREETPSENVPPAVLASRLARDLDKAVLPIPAMMQNEKPKRTEERKSEAAGEGRKMKRGKSPSSGKSRPKDDGRGETRRQRNIGESKRDSRKRTTSEDSSRHDTTSTHSREKSTTSSEPEDAGEKSHKRKAKSLPRCSPNRPSSKCSHVHSSKEDLREASRESTDRSGKSTKSETRRNFDDASSKSKLKRKSKNVDAKKTEEPAKAGKEEEGKSSAGSKVTGKSEPSGKKVVGDTERSLIYSDESTRDSLIPEVTQVEEQRGKKGNLALLEESYNREMAKTRKVKAMEKRRGKKEELRRMLLTPDEEDIPKKDTLARGKDKSSGSCEDPIKVWKHVTNVIDAVAKNRVEQLYEETSSESRGSALNRSLVKENVTAEILKESVAQTVDEATKTADPSDDKPKVSRAPEEKVESKLADSQDSGVVLELDEDVKVESEETETASETKRSSDNEGMQLKTEDNTSEKNTRVSSGSDSPDEESAENAENEISGEEGETKTLINIPADKKPDEDRGKEDTEDNQSKTADKSELLANREKETNEKKTTEDSRSPSPEVTPATTKQSEVSAEKPEKDEMSVVVPKEQDFPMESFQHSMMSIERASEDSGERRRRKELRAERGRSKNRNGRSGKQRGVVLRDAPPKEKKSSHDSEKHNAVKSEETKETEKQSGRPRSATKRRQREKSVPRNRRNSRHSEERGKGSRGRKREKSSSRGNSPYSGEPARKKANHSRRSSSPAVQTAVNEEQTRSRGRKRKRRPEISREEMASCKVMLIDCKYTYLSPSMHPRILKKLGISRINPYTAPPSVPSPVDDSAPTRLNRAETPSVVKFETSKESEQQPSSSSKERQSSPIEPVSSPEKSPEFSKERSSSPIESLPPLKQRPSPAEEQWDPLRSSPMEFPSSPKERPSSPVESIASPKPSPSPREILPTLKPIRLPSIESINRVDIVHDDDDDGDDDDDDDDDDENDEVEAIQCVNIADENLPLMSQSEDEEADSVVGVVEEAESVVDVAEDAESVEDVAEEVESVVDVAEKARQDVTDIAEQEAKDIVDVDEESAAPPDSTADNILVNDDNEENSHDESIREADTTDDIQVIGETITCPDDTIDVQEPPESEPETEGFEPRRTRYTVHKGPILDIKVLDDSFLAASEDGAIYRYSQKSNGILNIYKGHDAAVTCIYVLEMAGKCWKLYSGSLDGTFRCYDVTTGLQERPPADVGSPVQCMDQAWGIIFVGTKSGHVPRYNIKSGGMKGDRLEFSDKSVLALKASSEGPRRVLIVASRNQPITIKDAFTGLFLRTICGYKNHTVYSLMRERNLVYCGTSSTSIPVFDFTNGEQITQYNAGVGIVCMRLYRQILFAGCYDGNIYVFDTKETKLICSIPGPGNMLLSMEIVGDEIIAGSKNRQLHSWRMPKQVRVLLSERT